MTRGALSGLYAWLSDRLSRLPLHSKRRLQLALVAGLALAGACAVLVVALVFALGGSESSTSARALDGVPSPTPRSTGAAHPTATPTAAPTATPEAPYQASGTPGADVTTGNSADLQGPAAESGMRMVIPKIGVDAPVTVRTVGSDGVMGPPNGRFDVVWYDFSAYPGLGGYPGSSGNAVFSGHVDYHPHYEAVFWDLRLLAPGDLIEVYLPDGTVARYSVQWTQTISPDTDFSAYCRDTGEGTITIVTCQGTFDPATRQYDHRLVVRGVLIP